jgi:hypothetical protein
MKIVDFRQRQQLEAGNFGEDQSLMTYDLQVEEVRLAGLYALDDSCDAVVQERRGDVNCQTAG